MTLVAVEEAIRALVGYFSGRTVPGWTSLMVVLSLSNAALMAAVGVLGEYIGRIYEEGKGRPLYIVAEAWNLSHAPAPEESVGLRPAAASGESRGRSEGDWP
jgi:dolichol-phosphate mannosyltransferase